MFSIFFLVSKLQTAVIYMQEKATLPNGRSFPSFTEITVLLYTKACVTHPLSSKKPNKLFLSSLLRRTNVFIAVFNVSCLSFISFLRKFVYI